MIDLLALVSFGFVALLAVGAVLADRRKWETPKLPNLPRESRALYAQNLARAREPFNVQARMWSQERTRRQGVK